jgi:DNA-binding CsgD family transcriptional regulator
VAREPELSALAALAEGLIGAPAGIALEGDPGVGKTTLWRAGVEAAQARGARVLESRPAQAEAHLAYIGLGDLLRDVIDEALDGLAAPQADALRIALLIDRRAGASPDERGVAVAFLAALRALAERSPLLVAIDDAQWFDSSSAFVLAFAWRRVRGERVGLLLARRSGSGSSLRLDSDERVALHPLGPLSLGALHSMLHTRLGVTLTRPRLRRVHEVSGGNPFFALELARSYVEGRNGSDLPPMPARLREVVSERLATLPQPTRSALVVVAALSRPTLSLAVTAAGGEEPLRPAFEAGVLEVESERVRFSHPLLASGAYEAADPLELRHLHRRLASLVDDDAEHWRHEALAATGPDAAVAAGLDRAAAAQRARGAAAAAADLSEQARRLTPADDSAGTRRRRLSEAHYRWAAGDAGGASALLERAVACAPPGRERAEAMAGLARVLSVEGDQRRAVELAALALAEPDADDAVRIDAALALAWGKLLLREDLEEGARCAALAAELAERLGDRTLLANSLSAQGVLEAALGRGKAAATFAAAQAVHEVADARRVITSPEFDRSAFLIWTDRCTEAADLLRRFHAAGIEAGEEGSIALTAAQWGLAEYGLGHWAEASALATESYELALQTGERPQQALALSVRALVEASAGRESEARADARSALALAGDAGMAAARLHATWALGLLELSLERPAEVVELLGPERERLLAGGVGEPGSMRFVADEVEALIALGRPEEAQAVLGWLEERAAALHRASALAAAARCRGLLAAARGDGVAALAAFEHSLAAHAGTGDAFERTRTLLCLGAAQRRARHKRAARETLEAARELFERLGAALWSERVGAELERIGGRGPASEALTPSERRIVELVAEGGSNKQIATTLFVTPKTVETHLSRIYAKLGVHSRTQLLSRLGKA